MDFSQLKHFVCIAQLGGFSKAEEALDVSQPSLSRQMRLLEADLNTKLFLRTGRGVTLTPAGEIFLPHAMAILESIDRGRSALKAANTELVGRIAVGLVPRVARVLTPPLVQAFRARFPRASISVIEGKTPVLTEALNLGRIELAVVFNVDDNGELNLEPLCEEHYVLVGQRNDAGELPPSIDFEELANYPLILPPLSNSIRAKLEIARRRTNTEFQVAVEVETMPAVFDMVKLGIGYSVVGHGEISTRKDEIELTAARIEGMGSRNVTYLAHSRRLPATHLGNATTDLVRSLDIAKLLGAVPVRSPG
ncbi:LysR family transcriptional regulator [Verticiella sediminum]|uniref:LysR family transcriptional regulator n=1 Tax=Verticiella sediminum TaxID=1247510 RepID=A0A556AWP8_9BURK|nr:LysR family transcriptional regulator [Verticiella sediminum]TSH97368.1 LysR family transcriptional regulator [Verticiella sediminum]